MEGRWSGICTRSCRERMASTAMPLARRSDSVVVSGMEDLAKDHVVAAVIGGEIGAHGLRFLPYVSVVRPHNGTRARILLHNPLQVRGHCLVAIPRWRDRLVSGLLDDYGVLNGPIHFVSREIRQVYRTVLGEMLPDRSAEHTSELQSLRHLVCRLL